METFDLHTLKTLKRVVLPRKSPLNNWISNLGRFTTLSIHSKISDSNDSYCFSVKNSWLWLVTGPAMTERLALQQTALSATMLDSRFGGCRSGGGTGYWGPKEYVPYTSVFLFIWSRGRIGLPHILFPIILIFFKGYVLG